ncbi:hypothetical protein CRG98_016051 [Punica granatum]|uniref:Uncharacterized protein n=1 Tax=Punica granatum TaxID=22663 RepID=A0A2I0K5W3_PUNGR|nr:hypothetical protein CRG98_016051 [Punica granatum]
MDDDHSQASPACKGPSSLLLVGCQRSGDRTIALDRAKRHTWCLLVPYLQRSLEGGGRGLENAALDQKARGGDTVAAAMDDDIISSLPEHANIQDIIRTGRGNEDTKRFVRLVDDALMRSRDGMPRFRLNATVDMIPHVDRWVGLALDNRVEELIIAIIYDSANKFQCPVPTRVLSAQFIKSLTLEGRIKADGISADYYGIGLRTLPFIWTDNTPYSCAVGFKISFEQRPSGLWFERLQKFLIGWSATFRCLEPTVCLRQSICKAFARKEEYPGYPYCCSGAGGGFLCFCHELKGCEDWKG